MTEQDVHDSTAEAYHAVLRTVPENAVDAVQLKRFSRAMLPSMAMLPPIEHEQAWQRLRFLVQLARTSLSLARIAEGHLDATQILAEAGHTSDSELLYAIWASGGPQATTELSSHNGVATLTGYKPFCSGADIVDRALLYVDGNQQLIDVRTADLGSQQVEFESDSWKVEAMGATHTWSLRFHAVSKDMFDTVASPDWYLKRPGFWLGALGPAACWTGGALRLVDWTRQQKPKGTIAEIHIGAMLAAQTGMISALQWGIRAGAADPENLRSEAYARAMTVRHLVERHCTEIVDRFGRLFGPRPLVFEPAMANHINELQIYLRQCHADSDLQALGSHVLAAEDLLATDDL